MMPLPLDVGLRAGLVYMVLVLAIPIQYYLSNQMSVPSGQREASFKRFVFQTQKKIFIKLYSTGYRHDLHAQKSDAQNLDSCGLGTYT